MAVIVWGGSSQLIGLPVSLGFLALGLALGRARRFVTGILCGFRCILKVHLCRY